MIKDAYYFTHDSNARNDPKILAMRTKYGWEGYGWYWAIIEILREQGDYKLMLNQYTYSSLALQLQCSSDKLREFITDCSNDFVDQHGSLLHLNNNFLWSESLLRRMKYFDAARDRARYAAKKRWESIEENRENVANNMLENNDGNATAMQTHNGGNADAMPELCKESKVKESKVKESKVKESKVKESKVYTAIFNYWNMQNIVIHKKLNDQIIRSIKSTLKEYSYEEIIKSISNYKFILNDNNYFFVYKWELYEFLKRGIGKFVDLERAKTNYAKSVTKKVINSSYLNTPTEKQNEIKQKLEQRQKEAEEK